jgi:hypothetical protein
MKVLRRVPVRRVVAAADVPTLQAQTEMHPPAAHLQALLTAVRGVRRDGVDVIEMRALCGHETIPEWA